MNPAPSHPTSWRTSGAMLALLTVVPLVPTLRAAFVYDDTTIIRDNTWLRGWSALAHVWGQPYWPSDNGIDALGLYRPLHVALLSIVWNVGGGAAIWFHVYALCLAALATIAVWSIMRRATTAGAAFAAAAWFATHPLHVEAIASVANTSELLVVLCVVALVRILWDSSVPATRSADWRRAALIGAITSAALLSKESGLLALPIAAVTAWGWRRAHDSAETLATFLAANLRAGVASLLGILAVLAARSVALGTPVAHASIAAQGLDHLSAAERVRTMISLWPRIAGMVAWPRLLSPYYGPTIFPDATGILAGSSVIAVGSLVVAAIMLAARGERRPLVAVAWIGFTYFPASNLAAPTGQILADRTLFGVTVGAALLLAWTFDRLPRVMRLIALALCACLIARGAILTTRYATAWTSHRALWTRMIEAVPREHLGYKLLGIDAAARGDTTRALALLGKAFAMAPTDRQIRFEYGQQLYRTGRFALAATTLAPLMHEGDALAEGGLVAMYLDAAGRSGGPLAVIQASSRLLHSQSAPVAALYLGLADEQVGRRVEAESAYVAGLRANPRDTALAARLRLLRGLRQ